MPLYAYAHVGDNPDCRHAPEFEFEQVSRDPPLTVCPWCGKPVERLLSAAAIRTRPFDCELRDKGFTKLVRVDDGIYENKTLRDGETRYVDRRRPETLPRLEKTIED